MACVLLNDIKTNTYIDKKGAWYFLKTKLFFPEERIIFSGKHYCSLEVSTYINKKKKDAETMIFESTGSIPGTGQKHSLADALTTHIETVEKLKSMYKKD